VFNRISERFTLVAAGRIVFARQSTVLWDRNRRSVACQIATGFMRRGATRHRGRLLRMDVENWASGPFFSLTNRANDVLTSGNDEEV